MGELVLFFYHVGPGVKLILSALLPNTKHHYQLNHHTGPFKSLKFHFHLLICMYVGWGAHMLQCMCVGQSTTCSNSSLPLRVSWGWNSGHLTLLKVSLPFERSPQPQLLPSPGVDGDRPPLLVDPELFLERITQKGREACLKMWGFRCLKKQHRAPMNFSKLTRFFLLIYVIRIDNVYCIYSVNSALDSM